jgi:serine/threonine-protein kinase PpkA
MEIPGYDIQRCIGQGGMATAYLATQTSLDRQIVLKVLDTSDTDSAVTVERFLNEGRIVASLQHPNIITTYDIGTAGTDVYISMEFVDGGDLKQRLRQEIFAPAEAISLITKIAAALGAAHAKGIVHRDVKPGNILFREDGTPLLSDFGIAKRLTGDADLTSTGIFVGSPNYMAPEQSDIGPIDGRADIYALGVIFFKMLSGKRPYTSDSVIDVILMHKKDPVPALPAGLEGY